MPLRFEPDPLSAPAVRELIATHLRTMRALSPPESTHALEIDGLKQPGMQFWSVWRGPELVGCGALKRLSAKDGEIKSMHVLEAWRGRGIAAQILLYIEQAARSLGLSRLWLETGSMPAFEPARRLYRSHGYSLCGPFGEYREDPNSTFMTKDLDHAK